MNIANVMEELAGRLDAIDGLRVTGYFPGTISPPAAWVDMPPTIEFDATMGRGLDTMTLHIWVAVAKMDERNTRNALAPYLDGSGASSVKAALEVDEAATSFDTVRVASAELQPISIGGTEYYAATFSVDITGSGA